MSKIIVIDPGHGGHDPGAVGNELREKDLVLDIAKRTRAKLGAYTGVKVVMTRTTDEYLTLSERANIANRNKADLFVSIHINAGGGTGFETFIYNGNVSSNTRTLQNNVHAEIMKQIGGTDRGKKRANFAVIRQTTMPAVLTESLFIDRKADADKLKQSSYIDKLATGHAEGIAQYLGLKKASSKPEDKPESKPEKSTQRGIATVTVPSLNLRNAPNTKGKLIRELSKGEAYKVWDEQNGWLRLGKDMWASWQNGAYMNWTEKPTAKPKLKPKTLKVGQTVTLKKSASKFATGQSILSSVKGKKYKIIQVKSDRVLLDKIMSWVKKTDVQ